jgi:hypothetical protein
VKVDKTKDTSLLHHAYCSCKKVYEFWSDTTNSFCKLDHYSKVDSFPNCIKMVPLKKERVNELQCLFILLTADGDFGLKWELGLSSF